ncbi:MAG: hypothetical protein ACYC9M_06195 [Desulfobulbaceae bacterium]
MADKIGGTKVSVEAVGVIQWLQLDGNPQYPKFLLSGQHPLFDN